MFITSRHPHDCFFPHRQRTAETQESDADQALSIAFGETEQGRFFDGEKTDFVLFLNSSIYGGDARAGALPGKQRGCEIDVWFIHDLLSKITIARWSHE